MSVRDFDSGSSDYLEYSDLIIATTPLIVVWLGPTPGGAKQNIFTVRNDAGSKYYTGFIKVDGSGYPMWGMTVHAGLLATQKNTITWGPGGYPDEHYWCVAYAFLDDDLRRLYVGGDLKVSSALSRPLTIASGTTRLGRGEVAGGYYNDWMSGLWFGTSLPDEQSMIRAQAGGSLLDCEPSKMVAFYNNFGVRDPEPDLIGGRDMEVNGTTQLWTDVQRPAVPLSWGGAMIG